MKEAINILRKAINPIWGQSFRGRENPDRWHSPGDHAEHQLLNQPEHQAQGWRTTSASYPISPYKYVSRTNDWNTDWKKLGDNVKAIELRTGKVTSAYKSEHGPTSDGQFHHVIHRNPDNKGPNDSDNLPWKTTHVDTHTGKVGWSEHWDLEHALARRHGSFFDEGDIHSEHLPPAHITKIHYHDESK